MSRARRPLAAVVAVAAVAAFAPLGACNRDGGGQGDPPPMDRTLAKLKEAAERGDSAARPPPAVEDPNAALAEAATGERADEPTELRLPANNATVRLGSVAFKLVKLEASRAVRGGKLSLATDERFLRVELVGQNTGEASVSLDLGFARVVDGRQGEWALARDVQRMAGTKELAAPLPAGERRSYVLFFEIPRGGPREGWSLVLPAGVGSGNEDVRIPLG